MPVAIAVGGAVEAAFTPFRTDYSIDVSGQKRVDHRLQQMPHQIRGRVRQGLASRPAGSTVWGAVIVLTPFEWVAGDASKDHTVIAPTS